MGYTNAFDITETGLHPKGPLGKVVIHHQEREYNRPSPACKRPSEFWWGLPEQPENTCPMIDEAYELVQDAAGDLLQACKTAMRAASRADTAEEYQAALTELCEAIEPIAGALEDFDIENVRTNAEKLRNWGQAWKHQAKAKAAGVKPTIYNSLLALD